jgi:hypothetical protein
MTTFCIDLYESYLSTGTDLEVFLNVSDLRSRDGEILTYSITISIGVHGVVLAKNYPYFRGQSCTVL